MLCGVLHIAFQKADGSIDGHYMVCALYKSCFLLAVHHRKTSSFNIVAVIMLAGVQIAAPDSGRGNLYPRTVTIRCMLINVVARCALQLWFIYLEADFRVR